MHVFLKLIRDAYKLDILNVVTEYYHRKGGEKNGSIVLELLIPPEFLKVFTEI